MAQLDGVCAVPRLGEPRRLPDEPVEVVRLRGGGGLEVLARALAELSSLHTAGRGGGPGRGGRGCGGDGRCGG